MFGRRCDHRPPRFRTKVPWTPRNRALLGIVVFALINFMSFWVVAVLIGGDALNGTVRDGHYLLANHGHLHEVTRPVYLYSLWHGLSLFLTHPLGFACGIALERERKRAAEATREVKPGH